MSSTQEWRKCYICGEPVLWQTNGIGWHPIQYHDCKPVPLARLEQAERERDEANAELEIQVGYAQQHWQRMEQAVALLREAPDKDCDCEEGRTCCGCEHNRRKDALLAGQPAPVKPVVDDAMVERACSAMWGDDDGVHPTDQRTIMRAALVAALEGQT